MKIFILCVVVSLILLSCIFSPSNEDFAFKIKVKDLDGNPVKGLNVTLLNKFEHQFGPEFDWPKANTTIRLHLDRTAFVELIIQDIENNNIRTLSSSEFSEGNHSFVWNGKNDDDSYVSSGVYYCFMKASENDTLFYQHETIMYLSSFNKIHKNGSTNVDGTFEASKQPFINLYSYPDSIKLVDEESNNLGIEEFSDTTAICLFDPDPDSDDHQFEYVVVKDKNNTFNIIWDPESSWKNKLNTENISNSISNTVSREIVLSSFFITYQQNHTKIEWTTQSEIENFGWRIYRGEDETMANSMQLPPLIHGVGTSSESTDYSYIDNSSLIVGITYWYWLESIDYDGIKELYGPLSITIPENDNPNPPDFGDTELYGNCPNPFN